MRAHAVSSDIFPVPVGLLIWIPNQPYLFSEYRSYLLILRNTYLLFISVKNEFICLHRIKCRSQSGSLVVQQFWQAEVKAESVYAVWFLWGRIPSGWVVLCAMWTNFQCWKQHSRLAGVAGTTVLNLQHCIGASMLKAFPLLLLHLGALPWLV